MDARLVEALVGSTLAERYRIDRPVGSGGFGIVFAGTHTWLDIPIAIKFLRLDRVAERDQGSAADAFLSEARSLAQLRHDHIVRILDTGVRRARDGLPQLPWLVMEWCGGSTLAKEIARRGGEPQSREAVWRVMKPVLAAVAHAHENGLVHRDLKPANIMLVDGSPRVVDFGIAKLMDDDELTAADSASTRSDRRAFTPAYAAPEQLTGKRTGPWTDVHALALIITELLTGERAFAHADSGELMRAQLDDIRPTPAVRDVDAGGWEGVLARAMAYASSDRHANARELLDALTQDAPATTGTVSEPPAVSDHTEPDTLATDEPMAVPPTKTTRQVGPRRRRYGAVLAAGVAGAAVVAWWALQRPAEPTALAPSPTRTTQAETAVVGVHPYDGFSVDLLLARLRGAGWTPVLEARQAAREAWSQRIKVTSPQGKAVVLVHHFRKSRHAIAAREQMRDLVLQRRGAMLLAVTIVTGDVKAEELGQTLAQSPRPTSIDASATPVRDTGWERLAVPSSLDLNAVWGFESKHVYVVGAHGAILRFDGKRWHREDGDVAHDLIAVWGTGDDVFTVGQRGTILHRAAGRWTAEESGSDKGLYSIGGTVRGRVLAGGEAGLVLERHGGAWTATQTEETGNAIVKIIGGQDPAVVSLFGTTFHSPEPGVFVKQGTWPVDAQGLPELLLPDPASAGVRTNPHMVYPIPWSTRDWTPRGYVRRQGETLAVGSGGIVFQAAGGLHWTQIDLGVSQALTSVWAAPDGTVFVVGEDGVVFRRAAQSHVK